MGRSNSDAAWRPWILVVILLTLLNLIFFSFSWDLMKELLHVRAFRTQHLNTRVQVTKMHVEPQVVAPQIVAPVAPQGNNFEAKPEEKIWREDGGITAYDDTYIGHSWYGGDGFSHERFTIVMNTYGNYSSGDGGDNHYLEQIIASFYNISYFIQEIVICWDPPQYGWQEFVQRFRDSQIPVRVRLYTSNSLSHRFMPDPEIKTDCIMTLDDDITLVNATRLLYLFRVWQKYPDRLVGTVGANTAFNDEGVIWYKSMGGCPKYPTNMALTHGMFHHRNYLPMYWSDRMKPMRDLVDGYFTGEDIMMNFVVGNYLWNRTTLTKKLGANICIPAECWESLGRSHKDLPLSWRTYKHRHNVTRALYKFYGYLPLKGSHSWTIYNEVIDEYVERGYPQDSHSMIGRWGNGQKANHLFAYR